jgi:polysaccharide export outer membrane protein
MFSHQRSSGSLPGMRVMLLAFVLSSSSALNSQASALTGKDINSSSLAADKLAQIPRHDAPYLVGVDDVLAVSVWHEADLSRSVSVRPDGKISLPLLGEVQASGRTVLQLQSDIRSGLANFVKDPEVVVIVSEIRSQRINVIGEVTRAGAFPLTQSTSVIDAIALAGGLREFAKRKQIYVLRVTASGQRLRLPYNYTDVLKGKKNAQEIVLQPRDTVVVP